MPVQMELYKIIISEGQEQQLIVLKEVDGERKFPMIIGDEIARTIHRRLNGDAMPRPMTHDLMANMIEQLGATITRIEITDLQNRTFFARIHLQQDGRSVDVDSRPSDAIALGVTTSVPIFVSEHVLAEVC